MTSTPLPQRLYWNAGAQQINALSSEDVYHLSPCASPRLIDEAAKKRLDQFQMYLLDEGCTPNDISLACNLVHSYLSTDIYHEPLLLEGVWNYVVSVLEAIGIKDKYNSLPDPTIQGVSFSSLGYTDGDFESDSHNLNDGISHPTAQRIRLLLASLSEQHLAMVLRFPFRKTADRANAENLCKIWLQMHYSRRSKDRQHSRVILYDLYSNFQNMFRLQGLQELPDIKEIPGWEMTGYADNWADLKFTPNRPHRSPTASRSSLRSPTTTEGFGFRGHTRNRSSSNYLEPPKSPISASSSYTSLFDLNSQNPTNESKQAPWFERNNNPDITVANGNDYPVWKTMFAHLVAGARLEYLVETKRLVVMDVLVALSNPEFVTNDLATPQQRDALVDLGYYIFLRNRAINSKQAGNDRGVIETFVWPSNVGLDLIVQRLKEHLAATPIRRSQLPALSFLGHIDKSLQYCTFGTYEIGLVVRDNGTVVNPIQIRDELGTLE